MNRGAFSLALLLGATACQKASLATPTPSPILDLATDRAVRDIAETREILFGRGKRGHLLDGWSVDEHDPSGLSFVWATALEASVSFQVLAVEDLQFLLKLMAFPGAGPQTVTALVNGHEVSRFTAEPIFLEYRFVVPANVLHRGENRLTFRHGRLESRSDGGEARRFAAAYNSILIGPQCLPLRGFGLPLEPRVRRVRATKSSPAALVIIGPAVIRRRFDVPLDGVLRYRLSLLTPAQAPAIATLRIREGDSSRDVVETRLAPSLFDRKPSRDVEVDLTPWRGKSVELELEVEPEPCRTAVATVVLERGGIYAMEEGKAS